MTRSDLADAVHQARERVYRHATVTPLIPATDARADPSVSWKLECLQVTGSFKVRGAANKLEALRQRNECAGVVACSSGNHGRAVAYVANRLGIRAAIFVPRWADATKVEGMRKDGAQVHLTGETYDAAEEAATAFALQEGLPFVSPFDDLEVVGGQGTIGLEILAQTDGVDRIVIPLSGGGLASGIAAAVKAVAPGVRIVAATAQKARVMYESIRANRIVAVPEEPTLAGALAGGIGNPNRHTLAAVRDLVDEHVLVSEEAIADAMRHLWGAYRIVVEGGGAVAAAAVLSEGVSGTRCGRTAVIVTGANIESTRWNDVVRNGTS